MDASRCVRLAGRGIQQSPRGCTGVVRKVAQCAAGAVHASARELGFHEHREGLLGQAIRKAETERAAQVSNRSGGSREGSELHGADLFSRRVRLSGQRARIP